MPTLSTTSTESASSEEYPQATSSPNNGPSIDSNNPPCLHTGRCYCLDWDPTTHAPPRNMPSAVDTLTNLSAMAVPRSVEEEFQSHRASWDERDLPSPTHSLSGLPCSDQSIPLKTPLPPVDDVSSVEITPPPPGQERDISSRQVAEPRCVSAPGIQGGYGYGGSGQTGIPPLSPPGGLYMDVDIDGGFFHVGVRGFPDPIWESLRAAGLRYVELGPGICAVRPLK